MTFPPSQQATRSSFLWRLRTRSLALGRRTLLMGILNVTPDSFSDGGQFTDTDQALAHALRLLDQGADLLDLGGESTRPNASPVDAQEEQRRILPTLRAILRERPETIISVDTYHAETAERALDEGVEIINDVSGLLWDRAMGPLLARTRPGAVLMHTRGAPRVWSSLPPLPHDQIVPLVVSGLTHSLHLAEQAGIDADQIVLDPGFGFGKAGAENFVLLRNLAELRQFNLPLLAGISRKRFLAAVVQQQHQFTTEPSPAELRLHANSAAHTAAVLAGVHILRVHDVAAARAALSVADSLLLEASA